MQHMLRMGIDVGSTTVKVVLLDEHDNYLYKKYIRHYANILDTVYTLLQEAQVGHEDALVHVCITGSGGMAMAEKVRIPFVQEVIAETRAVKALYPETDVIIELGGEDAKVTYLGQTAEHRMNGSCAGGTGAFIDQMATLLQTDASGLNQLAMNADTIYPIAARCGATGLTNTPFDVTSNPKNIQITELEAAQIPRSIQDLDAAVINANYALPAGLNPTKDGLFVEKADSPYANLLSVNPGDENKPAIQKLAKALQSPEVKKFIEEHYKGAIIPAF